MSRKALRKLKSLWDLPFYPVFMDKGQMKKNRWQKDGSTKNRIRKQLVWDCFVRTRTWQFIQCQIIQEHNTQIIRFHLGPITR